jgi:HSP20 family protein
MEIIPYENRLGLLSRVFDDVWFPRTAFGSGGWMPAMDIVDDGDKYLISMDLPDVNPEEISIGIDHGVLTISGERQCETDSEKNNFRLIERQWGSFKRSVKIGESVDVDAIEAKLNNGSLKVSIPKKTVENSGRKIEITS